MDIKETGVQIRVPAVANLMIDSNDRSGLNPNVASNFIITKNQSILNGFFNRLAATEICLEWSVPNIQDSTAGIGNNVFEVIVGGTAYQAQLNAGFYNVKQVLDTIVATLNALPVPGVTFSIVEAVPGTAGVVLQGTAPFEVGDTLLANYLSQGVNVLPSPAPITDWPVFNPDIRVYRYLDFVSEQLTYNQDLKDDSTNAQMRNSLLRWYMAYSAEATTYDAYGFPVLMGYRPFVLAKQYSLPKQIRWDPRQPVGQLSFQVYVNDGGNETIPFPENDYASYWDWLMTLQVSEN